MSGDFESKKRIVKDIILDLHRGLAVEEARDRFEREVGSITSTEIAEIEQSLIMDGMSVEEIKKFCNVHALLFEAALQDSVKEESTAHPVYLFKQENREIEKITQALKETVERFDEENVESLKESIKVLLDKLRGIETHYTRKEQLLFPYLEKHGFMGPSKVMWGKNNEIRDMYKQALKDIEEIKEKEEFRLFTDKKLNPLVEEVEGMIFKEENILFPTSLEKLDSEDWVDILKESDQVGYAFIEQPEETSKLVESLKKAVAEEPSWEGNAVNFPSGTLDLHQLMHVLNSLPVELTFVDDKDTVRYFTENYKERIFVRTRSVIGRKVQNCHPPQSLEVVEKIVTSFREGSRDQADFWIKMKGRLFYILFLAVRDKTRKYLGTLEVTQDVTDLQALKGEKRLLDEET